MLKGVLIFILIALIGVVAYLSYLASVNFYLPPKSFEIKYVEKESLGFNDSLKQFYPNMRFKSSIISYYFGSECPQEKVTNMNKAFRYLENKTGMLKFNEQNPGDVEIRCGEQYEKEGLFVAGEGGPVTILNGTLFSVILTGQILLLYSESCSYNVELHELLHVLGFDHSSDPRSIMYSVSSCNQILSSDYINEIIRLYGVESLPDLYFSDVRALKRGIYLNLNMTVKNQGLDRSKEVDVSLKKDDKILDSFNLRSIDIGEGKIFTVENFRIPLGTRNIKLVIGDGRELDMDNNIAELNLED